MRRLILTALTAVLALALSGASGGSARPAQYDPNAYCCVDAITNVTYVPGKSLTVQLSYPDSSVSAKEVHAGTTLEGPGIVEMAWDGNVGEATGQSRPASVTFPSGADYTIGELSFTKDFYVQVWFICLVSDPWSVSHASPYCSRPNSNPNHAAEFYSKAYFVKVGKTTTTPATKPAGGKTNTVYVVRGKAQYVVDGKLHPITGRTALVAGEAIESGGNVAEVLLKEGHVTLSKHAVLRMQNGGNWYLRMGSAYFQGRFYDVISENTDLRSSGPATFELEAKTWGTERVKVYSGKVEVESSMVKMKPVVLTAGFQMLIPVKGAPKPPIKFNPPKNPFWK
ncbi:MAG: hypothetical protein ACXVZL_04665 [Gaiellaceae bacterium]